MYEHQQNTNQQNSATQATIAAAIQKSKIIEMTADEISECIKQMIQDNLFICEIADINENIQNDFRDRSSEYDTELYKNCEETEELDFCSGIQGNDSPTSGLEEGLDDNSTSDNAGISENDEPTEDTGVQIKSVQKEARYQDMFTCLQKQACDKRFSVHSGNALSDQSFSVLLILIYSLDEHGFLPKAIDAEEIKKLQATNGNDIFIPEVSNVDYQYVLDNISEINDCISFKRKIDVITPEIRHAFNALWSLTIAESLSSQGKHVPAGIGSRDMMEYHITLSKGVKDFPEWAQKMIKENHPLIMEKDFKQLSAITGKSVVEIKNVLAILGKFPPYPSYSFRPDATFCSPEISIRLNPRTGKYSTEFSRDGHIKPFVFNRSYLDIILPGAVQNTEINKLYTIKNFVQNEIEIRADIKKIVDKKIQKQATEAANFTSMIHQRQELLKGTAEYIVDNQTDFLKSGNNIDLKVLSQKDLADKLGATPSQISRIVNGKYASIQTENGFVIKELAWFFKNPEYEKYIDKIIREEDPQSPYNDTQLRSILAEQYHVNITQSTMVKARKNLGYPSAEDRKMVSSINEQGNP